MRMVACTATVVTVFTVLAIPASALKPKQTLDVWEYSGKMATPRSSFGMATLSDGRVIVAGGRDGGNRTLKSTEIWDPAENTWSATGDLSISKSDLALAVLPNGVVIATGGCSNWTSPTKCYGSTSDVEHYDPGTGHWSLQRKMKQARHGHSMVVLPNGTCIVAGGHGGTGLTLNSVEARDPVSLNWDTKSPMNGYRYRFGFAVVNNSTVTAFGGVSRISLKGISFSQNTIEIYDADHDNWTLGTNMTAPRSDQASVALKNGSVLSAGGGSTLYNISLNVSVKPIYEKSLYRTVDLYDPVMDVWSRVASLTLARMDAGVTILNNNTVAMAGGTDESGMILDSIVLWGVGTPVPPDHSLFIYLGIDVGAVVLIAMVGVYLHKIRMRKLRKIKAAANCNNGSINDEEPLLG